MRILHSSDRFEPVGDAEHFRDAWIARLAEEGHEQAHLSRSALAERRAPGLRVALRPDARADALCDSRLVVDLEELWAEGAPDLVHVHGCAGLPVELWPRLASKGVPVVHTAYGWDLLCPTGSMHWGDGTACAGGAAERCFFHECHGVVPFDGRDALKARLHERAARGLFARVVAPSGPLAARLAAHGFQGVRVVPHPGRLRTSATPRTEMPADPSLLYLGALDDAGGVTVLIEAFARLAKEHGRVRLRIAASGPHRGWYEELAKARGLADRVTFAPAPPDDAALQAELDVATVLVLPPIAAHALPRAAIEASRRALPIVATRVGALPALLDGRAVLVRPRDVAALAVHLGRLLADPARWAELSAALWRSPLGQDADDHARAMHAVYSEALAAPPPAAITTTDADDLDLIQRLYAQIASLESQLATVDAKRRAAVEEASWLESVLRRIASGRLSRTLLHWRGIRAIDEFPATWPPS